MNYPDMPNAIIPFTVTEFGEVVDSGYRGRSVLQAMLDFPLYRAQLVYPKLPWSYYEELQEFFYNRKAGALPFTFQCPIGHDGADISTARIPMWRRLYAGVGDGSTVTFDLPLKTYYGFLNTDMFVYVNGVVLTGFSITPNVGRDGRARLTCNTAPGAGLPITVSGRFQRTIDARFGRSDLSRPTGTAYVVMNVAVEIVEIRLDA